MNVLALCSGVGGLDLGVRIAARVICVPAVGDMEPIRSPPVPAASMPWPRA